MYLKAFLVLVLAVFAITGLGLLVGGFTPFPDWLPANPNYFDYFILGFKIVGFSVLAAVAFVITLGLIAEFLPNPKVKKRR